MSPTGLSKFLDGSEPYMPTLRKLRQWHSGITKPPEERL
jgi:hypothetical protein